MSFERNTDAPPIVYKSLNTAISESVHGFLAGATYGAAWGAVTPFPPPGSTNTVGMTMPLRPFSSLHAITSNALIFGSVVGVYNLSMKCMELARRKEDGFNSLFGLGAMAGYIQFISKTEERIVRHNRVVSWGLLGMIGYANLVAPFFGGGN